MKKILQKILFTLARAVLNKYQPKVIGITGSIGKSSAKEAVFAVLKNKFSVRTNIKNYNNEIGLPLSILGEASPGKSLGGWLKLFWRAIKLIIVDAKDYPEILILEMGIDRIGDLDYLTNLAPADIGIVTNVGPVHLEFFKTINKVAKEKSTLITKLKPGGWGVLNADNEYVLAMKNSVKGRFLTYGTNKEAKVKALETSLSYRGDQIVGLSFKLSYDGKIVPVLLPNVLAEHLIGAALSAACVGIILEMNLVEIAEALKDFSPPLGRMHLLDGIKKSKIIDDSYNASPESTVAAIKVLASINVHGQKFSVLGDMLELGDYEKEGHLEVGRAVAEAGSPRRSLRQPADAKAGIDFLVTVGERSKVISAEAIRNGFDRENIMHFNDSISAGDFLINQVKAGDMILVKGSQGMRMEKVSKALLADPSRAKELLVRQDEAWLNK